LGLVIHQTVDYKCSKMPRSPKPLDRSRWNLASFPSSWRSSAPPNFGLGLLSGFRWEMENF